MSRSTVPPTTRPGPVVPADYPLDMTLSTDEHKLLTLIAQSPEPVAMSSFFHDIHPPTFDQSAPEDDPRRDPWLEKQLGLYGASVALWEAGLVKVVHPANGERPDLVEVTDAGRDAVGNQA